MTVEKAQEILADLFTARDEGLEGVCFNKKHMAEGSKGYPVYKAVSEAQRESGLTFDFSYKIAEKAVDILAEVDWEDDDEIREMIDSSVPIYTSEIMEIYQSNAWAVDEAVKEFGNADSEQNAKYGWYKQIQDMIYYIQRNLKGIVS